MGHPSGGAGMSRKSHGSAGRCLSSSDRRAVAEASQRGIADWRRIRYTADMNDVLRVTGRVAIAGQLTNRDLEKYRYFRRWYIRAPLRERTCGRNERTSDLPWPRAAWPSAAGLTRRISVCIVATTRGHDFPSTACILQAKIGVKTVRRSMCRRFEWVHYGPHCVSSFVPANTRRAGVGARVIRASSMEGRHLCVSAWAGAVVPRRSDVPHFVEPLACCGSYQQCVGPGSGSGVFLGH